MGQMNDGKRNGDRWWGAFLGGIAVGTAMTALLSPRSGARNRTLIRGRLAHFFKLTARDFPNAVERRTEYMGGRLSGLTYNARRAVHAVPRREPPDLDQFLAHKVETEVFGRPEIPKGAINVEAVNGVVTVRGTVADSTVMGTILREIERVEGVREVVNLMKTPGDMPLPYTDPRR